MRRFLGRIKFPRCTGRCWRKLTRSPGWIAILLSLTVTVVLVGFVLWGSTRVPFIMIEAESETLEFRVARPEVAVVPVSQASAFPAIEGCRSLPEQDTLVTALVRPLDGTIVRYRHFGDVIGIELTGARINNEIRSAGDLIFLDEAKCKLPHYVRFLIKEQTRGELTNWTLPIAGPAEIGIEAGTALPPGESRRRVPTTMLSGSLHIFGRTAAIWNNGALYPAHDEALPLPAGGRLTSGVGLRDEGAEGLADWYGVAIIGENSFRISATTESNELRIFRPGNSSDAERYAVSVFARLLNDPSVAIFSLAVVIFAIAMQAIAGWIEIWRRFNDDD